MPQARATTATLTSADIQAPPCGDERQFRAMIDALPAAVYTTDAHGRLTHFNPECVALSGRTPQLGTDHWCVTWKLHHPDGTPMPHDQCPMAIALKERRVVSGVEAVAERPDGTRVWFEPHATPLFDDSGNLIGGINMLIDLTERRRAEAALRQSNQALQRERDSAQATLRSSPVPLLVLDGDLRVVTANEAFHRCFEVCEEQTQSRTVYELGDGQWDIPKLRELLHQILSQHNSFENFEVTHHFERIGRRTMLLNARRMEVAEGQPERIVLVIEDITDRKRAEDALRESVARFRMLADNIAQLAWTCDTLGNVTWYNRRWLDYTGLSFDEMKGWDWSKVHHPDHLDRVVARVKRAAEAGEVWEDTFPLRGSDGEYRWFLSRAVPIRDESGRIACWFGTNTDVTRERETEQALDMAREEAEAANRAKDRFLAVLSHELRTPLTPVLMTVAAMDMDPDLAPAVRNEIAMIRRNIELEAKLIDDLLDLSRVTAGKLRLNMETIDVSSAVRHACETCRPFILEKAIHLHVDLPHDTPFVTADAARLQQILWNLLKNASKFTPERGDIYVTVSTTDDRLRVEVRDTGVGIPPHVLPRIFNAFEQGDASVTRQFGGMGLGLAICKALAEAHGGTIRADSGGSDRGSVFTVEFPRLAPEHVAPMVRERGKDRCSAGTLRVLVVEDHADTARVLARLLSASGYVVKTAHTAAAALELVGAEPFDVIVSDIGLPDATGYDLMKQIKANYGIKGIAMSGYGMDEDLRKSREAGFEDHIVKPANVAQLERAIRRVGGAASDVL